MDEIKLSLGYSWKTLDKSSSRLDIHERRWINGALAWIFMKDVGRRHGRRSISFVFEAILVEDVAIKRN